VDYSDYSTLDGKGETMMESDETSTIVDIKIKTENGKKEMIMTPRRLIN
jgi:hypothetical protein